MVRRAAAFAGPVTRAPAARAAKLQLSSVSRQLSAVRENIESLVAAATKLLTANDTES